jgi:hypothetical protein
VRRGDTLPDKGRAGGHDRVMSRVARLPRRVLRCLLGAAGFEAPVWQTRIRRATTGSLTRHTHPISYLLHRRRQVLRSPNARAWSRRVPPRRHRHTARRPPTRGRAVKNPPLDQGSTFRFPLGYGNGGSSMCREFQFAGEVRRHDSRHHSGRAPCEPRTVLGRKTCGGGT